jgi:hypothetical protein
MAIDNIFTNEIFTDFILPWVLVFVLVFAILEKTKVFGDNKKQVNALIGAVSGLILLAFPGSRDVVVGIIPFMAILAVVLFVFIMLYGFVSGESKTKDLFNKGTKIAFGIGIVVAIAIALLVITDQWTTFWEFLTSSTTGINIIFIVVAAAAVAAVLAGKGKDKSGDE